MNYATLLSGGVDSSVAVHLLKEQGITPDCFYIRIGSKEDLDLDCTAEEDIEMASHVARKYGCKFEIIDLHRDYWENVVAYTIDKVRRGFTPNPDVMCNKLIKFGVFEERVGHAFDYVTTGHYADTELINDRTWLTTAPDPVKDQTDFLCQLSYNQIKKIRFPIGKLQKSEVREIAEREHLINAKRKDSQGICFLGKINYNDFLRRYLGEQVGHIVELETGNIMGQHKGFWFHTIGQRKGLGLSGGPWFVIKKDTEANIIYVSKGFDAAAQYGYEFHLADFRFITDDPWQIGILPHPEGDGSFDVSFKIRHTPEFTSAKLIREGQFMHIISSEAIQGIAPGQFGTIYSPDHHLVLGSGEIALP